MDKILVVGSGGREHAIAWRLSRDPSRPAVFCAPGNAGTASFARNVPVAATDVPGIVAWCRENRPDLVAIGPEAPLCAGLADALAEAGVTVFGPCAAAARIEGSKSFAKEIMAAAGVPTARARVFTSAAEARAALPEFGLPVVVKADGLAAGKGVVVAQTAAEAEAAIDSMLVGNAFGAAGAEVLVEEFLEGEEASILALVDGERAVLLPSSQDHKRVGDGDTGPNTGGMGAYSPAPVVAPETMPAIRDTVILPVVRELARRGIVYRGVLYAGLMIGPKGVNVLEFNARFGDPETEAVLMRVEGDFGAALAACANGTLRDDMVRISPEPAATVIVASKGYPGPYAKGKPVSGLDRAAQVPGAVVFHCGTAAAPDGATVTAGGRVFAVSARAASLRAAVDAAYRAVGEISFDGAFHRSDIAHRAFSR